MNRIGSELREFRWTWVILKPSAFFIKNCNVFRPDVCVTRQGSRLASLTAFQGSFVLAVVLWFLSP